MHGFGEKLSKCAFSALFVKLGLFRAFLLIYLSNMITGMVCDGVVQVLGDHEDEHDGLRQDKLHR